MNLATNQPTNQPDDSGDDTPDNPGNDNTGGGTTGDSSTTDPIIPENGFVVSGVESPLSLNGTYSLTSGNLTDPTACTWTNENGGHLKGFSGGYLIFGDTTSPAGNPSDCFFWSQGTGKLPWEMTTWNQGTYNVSGEIILTANTSGSTEQESPSEPEDSTTNNIVFTVANCSELVLNGDWIEESTNVYVKADDSTKKCTRDHGPGLWRFWSTETNMTLTVEAMSVSNPWDSDASWVSRNGEYPEASMTITKR